jgi:hypothetical protein
MSCSKDQGDNRRTGMEEHTAVPSPTDELLTAHDPPTRFEPAGSFPVNPRGLEAVTLDGTKAYTYTPEGGGLVVVDLSSGETTATARPEGVLPDGYLPALRNPPRTSVAPSCEQRAPAAATVAGRRLALALFPVVEAGSGTTPDTQAYEMVGLDTATEETAWRARLNLDEDRTTCHIAGVSGNTAVVVLGGDREFGVHQTTFGVDLTTRKVIWRQDNFDAQLVLGGRAVGGTQAANDWVSLASYDAGSGRRQWTSSVSGEWQLEVSVFSEHWLFVKGTGWASPGPAVVSLGDGRAGTFAGFGDETDVGRCYYDQRSRTFCWAKTDAGSEVTAYDAGSGRRLWRLGPSDTSGRLVPNLTAAFHGAVYGGVQRDEDQFEPVVLDGDTGNDRETEPGAAPWRVNEYVGLRPRGGSVSIDIAMD